MRVREERLLQYFAGRLLALYCPTAYKKFDGDRFASARNLSRRGPTEATSGTPIESISLNIPAADRAVMFNTVVRARRCDVEA